MATLSDALGADVDAGFTALFERTQHRVYALALSLCRNAAEAEDVAQDAFVRAYRALRSYSPARRRALRVHAWMATIATNVWRNRVRGRKRERVELDDQWPDTAPGPSEGVASADEAQRIRALVRTLPQKYRAPLALRYGYDLSYAEAARALKMPVGTVKANVHRGTRLLRDAFERRTRKGSG